MACSTCKKVKIEVPPVESGLPYSVAGGSRFVTGAQGRRYPIQYCLIPPTRQPRNGWEVEFTVHGQVHKINGTPHEIFREAKRLLDLNQIKYTSLDLWFNLNLQWTARAVDRYQKVRHSDLMAIAITNTNSDD